MLSSISNSSVKVGLLLFFQKRGNVATSYDIVIICMSTPFVWSKPSNFSEEISKRRPKHVVIIPDGNRRWAKKNGLPSTAGHLKGYERAKEIIRESRKQDIEFLTLWAFSSENWKRKDEEVKDLLVIILMSLKELHKEITQEKARFLHVGRKDRLSQEIVQMISRIEEDSKDYHGFSLCVAIDYGGEDELLRATERLKESGDNKKTLRDFLDTTLLGIPNPDFIIRTSGEERTSGFMPLQSVYSEWYFDQTLFPDFDKEAFNKALHNYSKRERRFGK
jgi:undecaprenyl diphosphate synthase